MASLLCWVISKIAIAMIYMVVLDWIFRSLIFQYWTQVVLKDRNQQVLQRNLLFSLYLVV